MGHISKGQIPIPKYKCLHIEKKKWLPTDYPVTLGSLPGTVGKKGSVHGAEVLSHLPGRICLKSHHSVT